MGLFNIIIASFLVGFFSSIVATGPVNFLVFRNAIIGKYGKSISMIIGAVTMEIAYCTLALTVVNTIFLESEKIQIFSKVISIFIFFFIGIYLIKNNIDKDIRSGVRRLTKKEMTKSFLAGFILVALNPTIILTWSAAVAFLISFGFIVIRNLFDIALFVLSAGLGMISGGVTMILFIKYYKMKFPKNIFRDILRLIGIGLIFASFYLFLRILTK